LDDAQARAENIPSPDKYEAVDVTKFKARRYTVVIAKQNFRRSDKIQ
jgi:hypothetical protein